MRASSKPCVREEQMLPRKVAFPPSVAVQHIVHASGFHVRMRLIKRHTRPSHSEARRLKGHLLVLLRLLFLSVI